MHFIYCLDNGDVLYLEEEEDEAGIGEVVVEPEEELNVTYSESAFARKGCVNHALHLSISGVVLNITVVVKARKVVASIRKSGKVRQQLAEAGATVVPTIACQTRWNGILDMIRSLITVMPAIDKAIEDGATFHDGFSALEKSQLRGLVELLTDFEMATKLFSSEKKVTMSLVVPSINRLIAHVTNKQDQIGLKAVCVNLRINLQKRFGHVIDCTHSTFDASYAAASFLDPRTSSVLPAELLESALQFIKALLKKHLRYVKFS
jgi:hypothetical protein